MRLLSKAGFAALVLVSSVAAASAMPRVPASALAPQSSDALIEVKGGHGGGHGHGHMGRGGRGPPYGWGPGRGDHHGWGRGPRHHRPHPWWSPPPGSGA